MNKIFVISGPSGVGKDTLMEAMIKKFPGLERAISYTDREKRIDDKPDSYHFISKNEFDSLLESGEIFEWEYARDERRYGSSRSEIQKRFDAGKNIIKVVGPKSFENFKKIFGEQVVGIFVKFESLELLKERIHNNRPDVSKKDIEIRYKQAFEDMQYEKFNDYSIVNPENQSDVAIARLANIIQKELNKK